MKILKSPGTFEIWHTPEELIAYLLRIERAGRICYRSQRPITVESAAKFVRKRLRADPPHESVLDHGWMTVEFTGCSRGFTHELVRHRLIAASQESTRYVDYARGSDQLNPTGAELHCVLPPRSTGDEVITLPDGRQVTTAWMLKQYEVFYQALRRVGWLPEDARQFLPTAIEARIVISADWREWRHIFAVRTGKTAHWEIRGVMCLLLVAVQRLVPVVFEDFVQAGVDRHGIPYFKQVPWT